MQPPDESMRHTQSGSLGLYPSVLGTVIIERPACTRPETKPNENHQGGRERGERQEQNKKKSEFSQTRAPSLSPKQTSIHTDIKTPAPPLPYQNRRYNRVVSDRFEQKCFRWRLPVSNILVVRRSLSPFPSLLLRLELCSLLLPVAKPEPDTTRRRRPGCLR